VLKHVSSAWLDFQQVHQLLLKIHELHQLLQILALNLAFTEKGLPILLDSVYFLDHQRSFYYSLFFS